MEDEIDKAPPVVRLRAFRATDDPEACNMFLEGHANVLTSIGITKVTSSKTEWPKNPAVFVIVVESLDGTKVFGGARVHVYGGTQPLPIEEATGALDPSIFDLVRRYAVDGTGEICGLWNSHELSGYGIGSPLLIRTGIAISTQIGLKTLFALCAPYTVKPVVNCGMVLEDSIGNKGTFYYPKLDLVATTMILKDVERLDQALEDDKTAIMQMRNQPDTLKVDELRNKKITINFQLTIPNLENWDLSEITRLAFSKSNHKTIDKDNIEFF
jgi:hypothetical protein